MRSKGSRFTLGVWGLRACSPRRCVCGRSRPQPSAAVRTNSVWPCLWEVLQRWSFLEVSNVSLFRFAWQAWHFVTFRRVLQRVENRFAWQAQYFCDVFRRFRGRRGNLWDVLKIDGSLAWNIDFEVADSEAAKCQNWRKSRTKCSFWCSHASRLESLVFLWLRRVYGKPQNLSFSKVFTSRLSCRLRGRRGTSWHSNLFDNVSKLSKLEEVSHEMLVFLHPRVSSRVAGFSVASPCLWGKLQKPLFFEGFQAGCHVVLCGRRGTSWHW